MPTDQRIEQRRKGTTPYYTKRGRRGAPKDRRKEDRGIEARRNTEMEEQNIMTTTQADTLKALKLAALTG